MSKYSIVRLKLKQGVRFVIREVRYSRCCGSTLPISSHYFSSAFRTEKEAIDELDATQSA